MMRFLDMKTDYAFKMVFGSEQNKDILISLLNSIVHFENDHKIKDLTLQDPYNLPLLEGMKNSFVDVKARLDNGKLVIIEMQVLKHEGFEQRILYNACKNYSAQLQEGDPYQLINPIIALNFVNFVMFGENKQLINHFQLLEKTLFTRYSGDIELIFVELPKFQKGLEELQELKEQWIYFVKNAELLHDIPESLDSHIQKALVQVNTAAMTPQELERIYKRREFSVVINSVKHQSFQEGREEGIEKGKLEIAHKMLASGTDLETVCHLTGLTKQQLEQ